MKKTIRKTVNGSVSIVKNKVRTTLNADQLTGNWNEIQDLAKKNLDPRHVRKGNVETFENAARRLNMSEEDIYSSYKHYNVRFFIFTAFMALSLVFLLDGIFKKDLPTVLISVASLLVFISNMFNSSFRCFQIRHRALYPIKSWIQNPSEWIPANYESSSSKPKRK